LKLLYFSEILTAIFLKKISFLLVFPNFRIYPFKNNRDIHSFPLFAFLKNKTNNFFCTPSFIFWQQQQTYFLPAVVKKLNRALCSMFQVYLLIFFSLIFLCSLKGSWWCCDDLIKVKSLLPASFFVANVFMGVGT
jgi:hypothetical protein